MFDINGSSIAISREDTAVFTVTFDGDDIPEDGTAVILTVKPSLEKESSVIEKQLQIQDGQIVIALNSEDTDLPPRHYYWDLRILYNNGEVFTPMQPGNFIIREVVGNV